MIPKARLDALTDGIFAFAMTLLVLDLRLPDGFAAASAGDLLHALSSLSGQLVAYVISFAVLGARWLGQIRSRAPETVSGSYARWSLVYLFFITGMPFSTMVVGRYGDLAPAVWLYAANIAASTAATLRLASLSGAPAVEAGGAPFRHFPAALFLASALLSVAISLFDPADAMWAYLLNVLLLVRWPRRHGAAAG